MRKKTVDLRFESLELMQEASCYLSHFEGSGKIFLLQSVLYEMCLCTENDPSVACYNRLLGLTGIGADREGKSNSERVSSAVVLEPLAWMTQWKLHCN